MKTTLRLLGSGILFGGITAVVVGGEPGEILAVFLASASLTILLMYNLVKE